MSRYIDLFAGIGGMRIGFDQAGARCVFTSEWDKFAQQTYAANFGDFPSGDITHIHADAIPDHDILLAGFPCQPFSIAGVSKKNSLGREHGFQDRTQGTLFFEIARILNAKRPTAFLLENVKNLQTHDRGRTFRVIIETLEQLGYHISWKIIDAAHYVPQHRERIFIVGLRRDQVAADAFVFPALPTRTIQLADILEPDVDPSYTLSDPLWTYLQAYAEKHRRKGNGFGYGLVDPAAATVTRTLSARYYKDGSEILIAQPGCNPRRLTPRECARLMGFSDTFIIPVSRTQAYRQFGNAVAVPVVAAIARALVNRLPLPIQPYPKAALPKWIPTWGGSAGMERLLNYNGYEDINRF
jgi:DNA (cytosine-5)-methyltransferase 1